jgi:hypothetical protein
MVPPSHRDLPVRAAWEPLPPLTRGPRSGTDRAREMVRLWTSAAYTQLCKRRLSTHAWVHRLGSVTSRTRLPSCHTERVALLIRSGLVGIPAGGLDWTQSWTQTPQHGMQRDRTEQDEGQVKALIIITYRHLSPRDSTAAPNLQNRGLGVRVPPLLPAPT